MFRGGEYGTRTPVELRETRDYNQETEFTLPVKQAATIGACFGYALVISPVIAIISAGDTAPWYVAGICMFTTFVWYLRRSGNLILEDGRPIVEQYDEYVYNSLMWFEILAGIGMSVMAGGVALCFHKVLAGLNIELPFWLRWIEDGVGRIIGIAQFPASLVMAWFVLLSFGQELAQRSPFQEQFVWKAVGALIESLGGHWLRELMNPRVPTLIREKQRGENDKPARVIPRAQMTEEEKDAAMMVEFIARGAQIGYTRAAWTGAKGTVMESTGTVMKTKKWCEISNKLKAAGILSDGKPTRLLCSVDEAIAHIYHPSLES